jgi:hypothetical protein
MSLNPQQKALTTSHINKQMNMNEQIKQANIQPLLTPKAIARGACSHLPFFPTKYLAAWIATYSFPYLLLTEW